MFSPQGFNKPEDLVPDDSRRIARFQEKRLPWEGEGEKSRPKKRLFYQVVLGELDLSASFEALLRRYADNAPERPSGKKSSPLAVIICDQRGVPAPDSVVLSSFGWGLPIALEGELHQLGQWRTESKRLTEELSRRLPRDDGEGSALTRAQLDSLFRWVVQQFGLDPALVRPPSFAVRTYQHMFVSGPPEPLLLNSFFLADLATARTSLEAGNAPASLQRYLGLTTPAAQVDVLRDPQELRRLLAPAATPTARWPGPLRSPLVALQQVAVNAALASSPGEVLAVNGPPGTGKTTLLRDVVAAVVTARAEVLATFDDPERAFRASTVTFTSNGAQVRLHHLDPRLRGFELVVASSNNKAVENVSAELPGLGAVSSDLPGLRYFSSLASALRGGDAWGLVAAVLGNASNRYQFQETFWSDEDRGLNTYLAVAAGTPRQFKEEGTGVLRPPRVVELEQPPSSHAEALARWRTARQQFAAALKASGQVRDSLQRIHALDQEVHERQARLEALEEQRPAAELPLSAALKTFAAAEARAQEDVHFLSGLEQRIRQHRVSQKPGLLPRLFRTASARPWLDELKQLQARLQEASRTSAQSQQALEAAGREQERALQVLREQEGRLASERRALEEARTQLTAAAARLGAPTGSAVAAASHAERQLSTAWFDTRAQHTRDELFVAAMALHRAFIDAAAAPLRHNLAGMMRELWTGAPRASAELVHDLWASLFLVIPLVSTTFASVEKMFGTLPLSSLGWLLIDEAGQATPQSAVGAVMRAKRAIVVGDPMQVEPVVMLPESLTRAVCERFGVDPTRFAAPTASVQTLADRVSPIVATFETKAGSRAVGVPLLVHRRCAEPMFGISNAVAYEHLMVQAKAQATSEIGRVLGPSRWLHVEGSGTSHWCEEEGEALLDLLRRLAQERVTPDLYVVSPFRAVAEQARDRVRRSGVLAPGTDVDRFVRDRIGTIHTVQGREAEAVIFVLGAPMATQAGARAWAGGRPNLLNVAVTRAKERLYVVGNREQWRRAGCFRELDAAL